jgi:RND superfamily putative drug exporter
MDYEVFLLSRIMEEHHRGADNTEAVARGLDRTGPVVTAAALLMAIVFGALMISGLTFLKQYALGLTIAVLLDAFVIRATLVPAVMQLAGNANWWAPRPLRRLHTAVGLGELDLSEPAPAGAPDGIAVPEPEVTARTGAP